MHNDIERILFTEESIRAGTQVTAANVTEAFGGEEFTVLAVLKGAAIFAADLVRCIPVPIQLSFLSASSYGDETNAGELQLSFFPAFSSEQEIEGRRILVVDDILDTGQTMQGVVAALAARGAAEVRTCVFLDKPARRQTEIEPDFRVFEVEDVFVVGYGLDFAGLYRNLPYVGVLDPRVYAEHQARPGV